MYRVSIIILLLLSCKNHTNINYLIKDNYELVMTCNITKGNLILSFENKQDRQIQIDNPCLKNTHIFVKDKVGNILQPENSIKVNPKCTTYKYKV